MTWKILAMLALALAILVYRRRPLPPELRLERVEQVLAELIGIDTKGQWPDTSVIWAMRYWRARAKN